MTDTQTIASAFDRLRLHERCYGLACIRYGRRAPSGADMIAMLKARERMDEVRAATLATVMAALDAQEAA